MLILIDNYDSFTYNLYQYLAELGADVAVFRNDKTTPDEIEKLSPERIVISPGPGTPDDSGITSDVLRRFAGRMPILGVCLGHQCIVDIYGGRIIRAGEVVHGKTSEVRHDGRAIFQGVANPFTATRYHSLIAERASIPECLEISAETDDGVVMGVRHRELLVEGVQFHPESILTEPGKQILGNFLELRV